LRRAKRVAKVCGIWYNKANKREAVESVMLLHSKQMELTEFGGLYDRVVPAGHILRRIKDEIDFSFVNPMLRKSYCESLGRPAKEPEMMFKLLFLKKLYDLSDAELMDSAHVNMAYKYFLDVTPADCLQTQLEQYYFVEIFVKTWYN
jgi:hypothetical protein